jgi:hypothetical protein
MLVNTVTTTLRSTLRFRSCRTEGEIEYNPLRAVLAMATR